MSEIVLKNLSDITRALQTMADQHGISRTRLAESGGSRNGPLVSLATGTRTTKDVSVRVLLPVFDYAGWKLILRPIYDGGITVETEGGLNLRVHAADGGPLEIRIRDMSDLRTALRTVAAANLTTVYALGVKAGSLTVPAFLGREQTSDLRFGRLRELVEVGGFHLVAQREHANRRSARLAAVREQVARRLSGEDAR